MLYVFDTDHLSLLQRRSPEGQTLLHRLQANQVAFSATVISYEEQTRGWMGHLTKAKTPPNKSLLTIDCDNMPLITATSRSFASMNRQFKPINSSENAILASVQWI
jgi:hypothetical protein